MATFTDTQTHSTYIEKGDAPILRIDCSGKVGRPEEVDIVFYHGSNCPDGFAAAYAAWTLLGDKAEYIPVEHPLNESTLPDVTGKRVVCVDYAFNAAVCKRMLAVAASFLILDHHASAVKEVADLPEANKVFEMMMSGATISWCYFHGAEDMPLFFRYLEDKDIWRWAFKGAEAFTAAYSALRCTFPVLDELRAKGTAGVDELIKEGSAIVAYKNGVRDSHVKRAVPATLLAAPRFKTRVVNASTLASEIGNQICKDGAELAVVWSYDHAKRHYYCSLRSDSDDVDVSIIAKSLGGGGHKRASGFCCSSLEDVLCYEDGTAVCSTAKESEGGAAAGTKRQKI